MTIDLALPILRKDQFEIVNHPAKIKVLAMGRRWGKSLVGGAITMNTLRLGGRVAWIVPEYKNGRALWRQAANVCAPLVQAKVMQMSKSERVITSSIGGYFGIYSADNIDSIRSEAFHLVVGDEAARIEEDGWNDAVRPTLADYDGDEFLISTPVGKNWFYYEFMKGQAENNGIKSWTAPTSANPLPNIRKAFEMAKTRVPERTYQQEWLAQFVDDGTLFRGVNDAAVLEVSEPEKGKQYVIGADWGRTNDATVFCVMDMDGNQALMDRMTNTDYASQRLRLKSLSEKYNGAVVLAESNSMGQPNIEALHEMNVPVQGFVTTNASKAEIVQSLELAFEQGTIKILADPTQTMELMAYQSEKMPSGITRYNAPSGMHDDTVIALALAWWAGAGSKNWFMS